MTKFACRVKPSVNHFAFTHPNFYTYICSLGIFSNLHSHVVCCVCAYIFEIHLRYVFCVCFHYVSVYKDCNISHFYYKLNFLVVKWKKKRINIMQNTLYICILHFIFYFSFFSSFKDNNFGSGVGSTNKE